MGFVVHVHLVHPDLPLAPTIRAHPDVTLRYEYDVTAGGTAYSFVSVFGGEYEPVERAMEADHTVSGPTRIATFENRAIFRVSVETDLGIVPDWCAGCGVFAFEITSVDPGWIARIHLPDRDVLTAFHDHYRTEGVSFTVKELYDSTASDNWSYFLTEQQYEILTMAYRAGYYDIPRSVSQSELAGRLDISTSAVSQRLRRAMGGLIAAMVENGRVPGS